MVRHRTRWQGAAEVAGLRWLITLVLSAILLAGGILYMVTRSKVLFGAGCTLLGLSGLWVCARRVRGWPEGAALLRCHDGPWWLFGIGILLAALSDVLTGLFGLR